jgi:predicted GNAT family N-acyltransferase
MGFYEKYGFVAQGDRFFEAGIPHFKMTYQP